MRLVAATLELLEALQRDPTEFAALLASPLPDGWPEFPEGIEFTVDKLREWPEQAGWWLHFFLDSEGRLVGSGGFVGPPDDGVVELGYEIAPEFRGNGYATAAAQAMVDKARTFGVVHTVVAHTLANEKANENPSTSVLRRLGFRFAGEVPDEEEGTVWRWEYVVE